KLLDIQWARYISGPLFPLVPTALAGLGLLSALHRRIPFFYGLVGVLYLCLALDTPIFALSVHLPLGQSFRMPERNLWVMTLGLAVMAAAGADAVLRPASTRWRRIVLAPVVFGLPVLLFRGLLVQLEWELLGILAVTVVVATLRAPGRMVALM